jgi:formate dehydrogenase subunit beta
MLIDDIREIVAARLETLDGVVALAEERTNIAPRLFAPGDDLSCLVLGPRYPLALTVREILKRHPEAHIGVVARGCQERSLIELANWKQLTLEQVEIIGFPCSAEQAAECRCALPYPEHMTVGEREQGVADQIVQEFLAAKTREERFAFWQRQFAKCIKCYGCRTICPLCFCEKCAMEQETWVVRGRIPVPFPTFHLIKAIHTAGMGKCVLCHACEDACPADIPLSLLYSLLRRDLKDTFGYEAGATHSGNPPVFLEP